MSVERLTQFDAVRLFIDRAVAVSPGFAVTSRNAPAVAQICWRLDGIPLAIELAASRVRALTVDQISARLDDRFKLLTGGSRAALPRQQTLRALIDWSHDLLSDDERAVFRRLAVFSGGFALEAAEQVSGVGEGTGGTDTQHLTPDTILDLLTQLVEKSLVLAEQEQDETRYTMLESVRQYALERLITCGELAAIRQRHARYFVDLAETAEDLLLTRERALWMSRIECEYDNLRAVHAMARSAAAIAETSEEIQLGLRLVGALCWFWVLRGTQPEGLTWVEAVLERAQGPVLTERPKALMAAGVLAAFSGQHDLARRRLAEAVDEWRPSAEPVVLAMSLVFAGVVNASSEATIWETGSVAAGVQLFRENGDTRGLALALRIGGILAYFGGARTLAKAITEEAVRHFYRLRDLWFVAQGLNSLGDFARNEGDDVRAAELYAETLGICREQGLRGMLPSVLQNLAFVALRQGKPREAQQSFCECLGLFQANRDQRGVAECLGGLASAHAAFGQIETAARLIGATEATLSATGAIMWPANRGQYERMRSEVMARLGNEAFESLCAEGRSLTSDQAIALARSLPT
jgi:hypothetical protein